MNYLIIAIIFVVIFAIIEGYLITQFELNLSTTELIIKTVIFIILLLLIDYFTQGKIRKIISIIVIAIVIMLFIYICSMFLLILM